MQWRFVKVMIYHTLEQIDIHSLHSAFIVAFSDYQVNMNFPFVRFEQMMRRRGFIPQFSIGAFDEGKLVGFSLTGLRLWNGILTAYDIATGVTPEYRRRGITSEIFLRENALLKNRHVGQYLLEVIKENLPAVRLYQKQGFRVRREFSCFQIDKRQLTPCLRHPTERISGIGWKQGEMFWDFEPSWQNSTASVSAATETFINVAARLNGEVIGYGMIDPETGDIPQLAVNPKYRRGGVGTSLLTELANNTQAEKVRVLNMDVSQNTVLRFLTVLGFEHYISQYEMILPIR